MTGSAGAPLRPLGGAGVRPPGAATLRPLGVTEVLDSAVRLARRNARSVLVASAPYAVVASAATALLQYWTITSKDAAVIAAMGTLLIPAAFGAVLTGFLAPLYTSDLLGTPIAIGESARRVGRRTAALLVLGLAILVGEGIGLAACLAGGVWLWGVWAVAAPALVLERQGVRAAFRRSVALVRGTFWRVWGIRALGWLLTYVLGQLILLPLSLLALWASGADPLQTSGDAANAGVYVAILAGGQLISSAVLAPVSAAIDVLLYTDLRMRKEGMDIALRLPARPAPAGTGQPAVSAW